MADFFETDEVVKGYDSKITLRILSYLKPYKTLITVTAIALILSTLGELLVPILQQQIIDDAIVIRFHTINLDAVPESGAAASISGESGNALTLFMEYPRSIEAGGRVFVPIERNTRISANVERELRENGILDEGDWYAFRYAHDSSAAETIKNRV